MQFFVHGIRSVRAAAASFNAWIDRHRAVVDRLRYCASFALLFGASAYDTYQAALAQAARERCGAICLATPGFYYLAAAACGAVAILAALAYAVLRRALVRRWPEFRDGDFGWVVVAFAVVQFESLLGAPGYARSPLFIIGCWLGSIGVLEFFWSRLAIKPAGGLESGGYA